MRYSLLVILGLLHGYVAFSQTGNGLRGTITSSDTDEPLIGATISSGQIASVAQFDGSYQLDLLPGIHQVLISYVGFETQSRQIEIKAGEYQELNVRLKTAATLLETATITSGRFERPLGETTVSLEILRPAFIEHLNVVSIDEALSRLPGVNIIDGQANIRGGSGFSYGAGSRVLLLVDDIPALQSDAGFPNWNDIPVENLEQVEVMKGAGSALYGSAAMNGIIHVRTAFARSTPYSKVSSFYTAWMTPKNKESRWWRNSPSSTGIQWTHRQKFGKLDVSGSMFYINTQSYIQDAYNEQGRVTLGLRYRANDRLTFGLNTNINTGRSQDFFLWANDTDGAYKGGGANNNTISEKFRYFLDPHLTYFDKSGNKHKFMGRLYGIDNDNNLDQSNRSQLYYSEYQFQRHLHGVDLVLTAGALGTYSRVDAELYGDTTFQSRNAAAYVQLEKKIRQWLTLTAGARLEHHAFVTPDSILGQYIPSELNSETRPVFRLGANARLNPFSFLRASWGQGYRFPTIAEKFINTNFGGFQVIPNVQLGSERGWSAEIGWKQGVKMGRWNGFIDLAAFWTSYQDMMEFSVVVLPKFQSQNIGNTLIRGIELTWNGQGTVFGKPMTMMAGILHIDPRYQDFSDAQRNTSSSDRNVLKYRFRNTATLDLEMPVHPRWTLGYSYQYFSHMEAIDAIFNIIPGVYNFREAHNTGAHVMDFRLGLQLNGPFDLWLVMKNALNEAYSMRPGLLEAPRSLSLRLNMTLQ